MAAPTYSAGTVGGVLNLSVAATKNAAALVDLSTVLGGKLTCQMATGGTAPTAATTFAAYAVAGATAAGNTTLSATATGGSSSTLSVASSAIAATIQKGQKIAVVGATSKVGEIVTVSSVSGTTLTLSGPVTNSYAVGDLVFLIEQTASGGSIAPGSSWSSNSTYGGSIYPPSSFVWILQAANADTAQPVTATVTLDTNPAFA